VRKWLVLGLFYLFYERIKFIFSFAEDNFLVSIIIPFCLNFNARQSSQKQGLLLNFWNILFVKISVESMCEI
jgi:hypothetical protein